MSLSSGPTTIAVCGPRTTGFLVTLGGRTGVLNGTQKKWFR